jgi:hypothetical protein
VVLARKITTEYTEKHRRHRTREEKDEYTEKTPGYTNSIGQLIRVYEPDSGNI